MKRRHFRTNLARPCVGTVRYQGEIAPLSRSRFWFAGAWWRGVRFVSERDGYFASHSERGWQEQYGHLFPDRMPLEAAQLLLGLPESFTTEDVITAFRRAAKRSIPTRAARRSSSRTW